MPVKKDAYGRRWIEVEFVVPGNQEEVWRAVATGPGISSWFAATRLEERVGGELKFEMGGGMSSQGVVTHWEPPHRLAYVEPVWSEGAPPCATEVLVAERKGGNSVFHMSHTVFWPDEKWDDQLESFEKGWQGFTEVLKIYLRDFAGQPAAMIGLQASHPGSEEEAWRKLSEALGCAGAGYGEERRAPAPAPPFAGKVERRLESAPSRELLVRLEEPQGVALAAVYRWMETTYAGLSLFYYGAGAAAAKARHEGQWNDWMKALFPAASS